MVAIAVGAAAMAPVLLRLHRPLPIVSGSLLVDGASAPIEVLRDRYGVPHIRAQSRDDAIFGLGFVHAQDRLWQMEIQRRAAAGRLAEALGPEALPTDRFIRTLGFARAARTALAALDADTVAALDAYVRGVNAFLTQTSGWRLPIEYGLTGVQPEAWTAHDVVATTKLMGWAQGMNWREEFLHLRVAARVGPAGAAELLPREFDGATVLPAHTPEMSAALEDLAGLLGRIAPVPASVPSPWEPSAGGSNAWVIDGGRTTTGRPILASDPHIAAQTPATWYLAHLTGGDLDVIGATFPGSCGVVIGHNGHVAWGVTNAMADAQDLFPVAPGAPVTVLEEIIRIKGGGEERLTIRLTAEGPIISDLVRERAPLALRWTGLDATDASISGFLELNLARDAAGVRAALSRVHAPVLGVVYATAGGDIGYLAAGSIPERGAGRAWSGQLRAGRSAAALNPPTGFIVTANNPIGGPAPQMSDSFDLSYRAERIAAMIQAESALSMDDVARMQADVVSHQPRALAPLLFEMVEPVDARSASALAVLRAWDGRMLPGSAEAAIFKRYYAEAAKAMLRDELGEQLWIEYESAAAPLARAMHRFARRGPGAWCDDVELPGTQTCGSVLGDALDRALDALEQQQGSSMRAWRWDAANVVRFPHTPLDAVAWLRPFFSRELRRGGDGFTVNPSMPLRGQMLVASYRQVVDTGDWDNSRFILPLGQSGHPLSAHYDDMLPLWNQGRYVPMLFSEAAVRRSAWWTLTLRPRPAPSSSADIPREK